MSLILVVDPDSRHAAQLQSMARTHLHSEILLADSADRAVAALAHRVPDIVLTAPLLPGHDEAVLSEYLRALGTAAAHVQTLTIPILSGTATAPERTARRTLAVRICTWRRKPLSSAMPIDLSCAAGHAPCSAL